MSEAEVEQLFLLNRLQAMTTLLPNRATDVATQHLTLVPSASISHAVFLSRTRLQASSFTFYLHCLLFASNLGL